MSTEWDSASSAIATIAAEGDDEPPSTGAGRSVHAGLNISADRASHPTGSGMAGSVDGGAPTGVRQVPHDGSSSGPPSGAPPGLPTSGPVVGSGSVGDAVGTGWTSWVGSPRTVFPPGGAFAPTDDEPFGFRPQRRPAAAPPAPPAPPALPSVDSPGIPGAASPVGQSQPLPAQALAPSPVAPLPAAPAAAPTRSPMAPATLPASPVGEGFGNPSPLLSPLTVIPAVPSSVPPSIQPRRIAQPRIQLPLLSVPSMDAPADNRSEARAEAPATPVAPAPAARQPDPAVARPAAGSDVRPEAKRPAKPRITGGSDGVRAFRRAFFPEASNREWNDWHWQTRNRVRNLAAMERMLVLSEDERRAMQEGGSMLPIGVTPYYMALLDRHDPAHPIRRTVVPTVNEWTRTTGEADDPLGEDGHSPVPGLVHRYPDRVLLLALDFCTTYCRYCTRSRVVGHGEIAPGKQRLERIFEYLRAHTEVRDVLISGGDPLSLADDKIDWILGELRKIPHIEFVRLGTKIPSVLPMRITSSLAKMLRKHHPLWMSVHYLHPDECTTEAYEATGRLADAGIPLGSQTVLLKGVNDSVPVMKSLMHHLLRMRVRPYYLYQCDPISGSAHFRTTVEKGLEIIAGLRGHTTGYACPTYVIDAPGGGGKIPLQPGYVVGRDGGDLVLRNFEGKQYRYPDPQ